MTRINTNVSSLIAQKTLARSNTDLQTALTRLSTGLRINVGKDDPAGLIASEALRSDIISVEKAISNSERANQLIATADSALGQVSSLLNDIRGLVTEAANVGALSEDQIAANQLQIDASLEAIDRIAQVTTFQGRKVLDGSLAFLTTAGEGFNTVTNLQINQANLGRSGQLGVDIAIANAATRAAITNESIGFVAGEAATGTLTFEDVTAPGEASSGTLTFTDINTPEAAAEGTITFTDITQAAAAAAGTITFSDITVAGNAAAGSLVFQEITTPETLSSRDFTALFTSTAELTIAVRSGHADGDLAGTGGDAVTVTIQSGDTGGAHATAAYNDVAKTLVITVDNQDRTGGGGSDNQVSVSMADIVAALNADTNFTDNFEVLASANSFVHADDDGDVTAENLQGGVDEVTNDSVITITAQADGVAFDATVVFQRSGLVNQGDETAVVDAGVITITVNDTYNYTFTELETLINAELDSQGYNAVLTTNDIVSGEIDDADRVIEVDVTGGVDEETADDVITITSLETGESFNGTLAFQTSDQVAAGDVEVEVLTDGDGNFTGITVTVNDNHNYNDLAALATAIDGQLTAQGFSAALTLNDADGAFNSATDTADAEDLAGGLDEETADDVITITSLETGAAFNGTLAFQTSDQVAAGDVEVEVLTDGDGNFTGITVTVNDNHNYNDLGALATAINGQLTAQGFSAALTLNDADGAFNSATDTAVAEDLAGGDDEDATSDVITITALQNGEAFDGEIVFNVSDTVAAGEVAVDVTDGVITITVNDDHNYDLEELAGLINDALEEHGYGAELTANDSDGEFASAADAVVATDLTGGVDDEVAADVITITATATGEAFNGTINIVTDADAEAGSITASFADGVLTITLDDSSTYELADIVDAINDQLGDDFTAELTGEDADGQFVAGTDDAPTGELEGGSDDGGAGLTANLVVEISGRNGSEVFSFEAGTTLDQIVNAINLVGDATGVQAQNNEGELSLSSSAYGSAAFVDVNVISEGEDGGFGAGLSSTRTNGTDIDATVNGVKASGSGNTLKLNTATLELQLTVAEGSDTDVSFTITGGGAQFQLGPKVVSNQQARLGIQSVNTARLGGAAGKLFELRSGGTASLANDTTRAAQIVDEVISIVTSLRGRLGAFQKTTLDSNIASLNDTLANLKEAESSIRDADFAAETARLTRAQILVQSGTQVLGIANSNPQNVLALLR